MKKSLFAMLSVLILYSVAAQQKVFPDNPDFKDLENIDGKFQAYLEKNKVAKLTPEELAECLKITNHTAELMNLNWQQNYIGYIKRVEANIYFKTALLIGEQPAFSNSVELMKKALFYVDMGFMNLNVFASQPQGIELDGSLYTMPVDEEPAIRIRDYIYENTGEGLKTLEDYYNHFDVFYSLHAPAGQDEYYLYEMVGRAIRVSLKLKLYDQRLIGLCFGVLANNTHGSRQSEFMSTEALAHWQKLQQKIAQAFDAVLANATNGNKFRLAIPQFYLIDKEGASILPLINNFDKAGMLLTYTADGTGNRSTMNLMQYAAMMVDEHVGGDVETAAEELLQKHFHDLIDVARIYYTPTNSSECNSLRWIADHMDKYPVDEEGKKYINKCIKKCKDLR